MIMLFRVRFFYRFDIIFIVSNDGDGTPSSNGDGNDDDHEVK